MVRDIVASGFRGSTTECLMIEFVFLVFPALVLAAAATDLARMKIPNRISLALAGGFFLCAPVAGLGLAEIGWHLGVAALVLLATFGMFAMGWLGAGDAKLASAVALWLGTPATPLFLIATALAGAVLALALVAFRATRFALAWDWLARLRDRTNKVPYGVALAIGALVAYPRSPFLPAVLA